MSTLKERIQKINKIKDSEIDYSDIPELDDNFWKNAVVVQPRKKTAITLRLDTDTLEWFKHQGRGYQTVINSVLKSYMNAKKHSY